MNTDGTVDDQQMVSVTERENFIARLANHLGGNRELAILYDDTAYTRSEGKLIMYKRILQLLIHRNQQQQQQSMINSQGQQMYMPPQPAYGMQVQTQGSTPSASMMNVKQELMMPPMQQQMRMQQQPPQYSQQTPVLPPQPNATAPLQQRTLVQHLQQVRQQPDVANPPQLQSINPPIPPQASSSSGSQDEILQHILTSPNPPKQTPSTAPSAVQARLRTVNRPIRQPISTAQQSSPMTPGTDSMNTAVSSPLSHPNIPQQPVPGQSPLARYMMAQSPQNAMHRAQMSPMNVLNYGNSPNPPMIDDEMQFLIKFFSDRLQYLVRIINRCQQEGQADRMAKYRQLHEQISAFIRNPSSEHLVLARRLKEHLDRIFNPANTESSTAPAPTTASTTRLITPGIFEQCQTTITDYLGRDTTLKYSISKRFLEPLSEVLNGVAHKNIRLDADSKAFLETNNQSPNVLTDTIENELASLAINRYSYELKPFQTKHSSTLSINKNRESSASEYELTCRLTELDMPIVPPLKMKLTVRYPYEPPEILSFTNSSTNPTPIKLENSDGNSFFESISRNFIYFLSKLPTQHTISDVLHIWRTSIANASEP